jgi:hypothetical protein
MHVPEDRQNEPSEKKKEAPKVRKIVGNVKPPEFPKKGGRKPTYEHG